MPPYTIVTTLPLEEIHPVAEKTQPKSVQEEDRSYRTLWGQFQAPLIWPNIIGLFILHAIAVSGFSEFPFLNHKLTAAWAFFTGWAGGFGVTAGAHRLWCHRSYKATTPLRVILMICYSLAGQNKIYDWVRDHRVHHKFSETDADPHNANRGFFFAHVGWLMMKKHPEVVRKGRQVDCSDVLADPVVAFHEKHFWLLKFIICFFVPAIVPYYGWGETPYWCFVSTMARFASGLNCTWLVNSAAHMFGNKPYDRKIQPVENLVVSLASMGEGWHNYHHTFPWDYKAAELGNYAVNMTTCLLDAFAKIGWAYDLKSPTKELVEKTILSHGDGSHANHAIIASNTNEPQKIIKSS